MDCAGSNTQVTTPRNDHDERLPATSASRFRREGRGWVLRLPTRRTAIRIVSDAQLLRERPTLTGRLLPV
jgi:hypothetical protein